MSDRLARHSQITLGLLWLIDGALQFQPYMFGKSFVTGVLLPSAAGQPGFIAGPISWAAHLIEPHVAVFNGFAAGLEVLIGVGLLYRPTVRLALMLSFVWAAGIWFIGEGLGMLLTGAASPLTGAPGAAPLYVLAGIMCWPGQAPTGSVHQSRPVGLIGDRSARLAWGAIWLGSAVLWLLPANSRNPGAAIAIVLAITSGIVGLSLLYGWRPRAVLAVQISLGVVYWVLGQRLGGLFTGQATDVGTAPLMILIGARVCGSSGRTAWGPRTQPFFLPATRPGSRRVLSAGEVPDVH
jgi:hypothetical protein